MRTKEEIIKELNEHAVKLSRTPGRRDVHWKFYYDCVNEFGSLNEAKKAAGLKTFKRTADILSEDVKEKTLELVRIVSYITGDGHLHKDLKGFLHSSKDINSLKNFEECVRKQFGIEVSKIQEANDTAYGEGTQYRYFNTAVAKFLYEIGTPRGDKVITVFEIPDWIREDSKFMVEYLKILFYCEGSKTKEESNIKIAMSKADKILVDGQRFMGSLAQSLDEIGIKTTRVWTSKAKRRNKDNEETTVVAFGIRRAYIDKFLKEVGWLK